MKTIINDIKLIFSSKLFYYILFSLILVLFILYHRGFFRPHVFWIYYTSILFFAIPTYFYIFMEEQTINLKIPYSILFSIFSIFIASLMYNKNLRKTFLQNTPMLISIIVIFIPLIIYFFIKKDIILRELGFSFIHWKLALLLTLISIIIMVPIVIIASRTGDFHKVYPLFRIMKKGGWTFVKFELYFLLFFVFWEFLFRGFMLFAFAKHTDYRIAIFLQTIIFAFAHYGKPEIETLSSIFGGIFLGIIIYRVKNILPAAIIHFIIALTMDIMSVYF